MTTTAAVDKAVPIKSDLSEPGHSPLPWTVERYTNYVGWSIWSGNRGCIAERWYDREQSQPYGDEITANAKLICLAVNSHAALVAALESIARLKNPHSNPLMHAQYAANQSKMIATEALKLARGEG